MFHAFMLFLGLSTPYFKVGDHICTTLNNEFMKNTMDWYILKVGKNNYFMGSQYPYNSRALNLEGDIGFKDGDYHICKANEVNE